MRPAETTATFTLPLGQHPGLRRRFMVVDEALRGNVRFGLLLEVLDKLAEEAALEYARTAHRDARVVTAAVDGILVRNPVDLMRDVQFAARLNHVGRTSMEVGIRVTQPGDPPLHVASCYFTMVARLGFGDDAKSLPLPPLEYLEDLERRRAHRAVERREEYRRHVAAAQEPPTREEFELLASLHAQQEETSFRGPLVGRLAVENWERMYPEQENVPQKIFGGYLMRRAYELATICAELVAPDRPVLAAVNRVNFLHPVRLGDTLHFTDRVVYTSGNLVSVEASIERRSRDRSVRALSNSCLFTFVNMDREMVPRPTQTVYPTTYSEDARLLEARRHHAELSRHIAKGWIAGRGGTGQGDGT
ncbi:MAG TPA: hotdog domain-containing protein [Anaeromyxobacteraceae bacterium]|nr:hotdog domain-containing protein [Anaeromyxobacteraceae bacterium]